MVKYSRNIYKLREIFSQTHVDSKNNNNAFDYEKIKQRKILAMLLAQGQLATPELSRSFTKSLLSGEESWPKIDGTYHKIEHLVKIDELEKYGFVSFYADRCKPHFRTVSDPTILHPSVKAVYDVLIFIRNIQWGADNFVKIHHKIEKKLAKIAVAEIADESYLKHMSSLAEDETHYHVQLEQHDFDQALANFLWSTLTSAHSTEIALEKYIDICKTYVNDIFVPHLNGQDERNQFITAFESYIANDSELDSSWETISSRMKYSELFNHMVIASSTRINISIDGEAGRSIHETIDGPAEGIALTDIVNHLGGKLENLSDPIEISKWWNRTDSYFRYYEIFPYGSLFYVLVDDSITIDRNAIFSNEFVANLVESASSRETLKHLLLGFLPDMRRNVNFILYLLTTKEYSEVAMFLVIKQLHKKSHEYENESYASFWWEIAVDEFLDVHFTKDNCPNVGGIIRLIFDLGANINFAHLNTTSMFYLKALDIILNKLKCRVSPPFIEELVKTIEGNQYQNSGYAWKLYVLFWVLENSQSLKLQPKLYLSTQEAIFSVYKNNVFEKVGAVDVNPNTYVDNFPWAKVKDATVIKAFLDLVKSPKPWIEKLKAGQGEKENPFRIVPILKNFTQILVNLYLSRRNESEKATILNKIIDLVGILGFADAPNTVGIFDTYAISMNETYSPWESICKLIDQMDVSQFNRFIAVAETNMPPDRLLVACRMTTKISRQNKLIELLVNDGPAGANENGIAVITDALVIATNLNLHTVVDGLIEQGERQFKENSYLRSSNSRAQYWRDQWLGLKYKVALARIVDGAKEYSNGLEREINDAKLNVNISTETGKKVNQECLEYRRFVQAKVLLHNNPQKSYEILNELCTTSGQSIYVEERFVAHLRMLEEKISDPEKYEDALTEYQNSSKEGDLQRLNDYIVANLIHCFSVLKKTTEADMIWSSLSISQRCSPVVAKIYSKELINRSLYEMADAVLKTMEAFHGSDIIDPEVEALILKIKEESLSGVKTKEKIEAIISVSNRIPTSDEMTKIFRIIKGSSLEEIAAITTGNAITKAEFLHIQVIEICKELLHRKKNIQIAFAQGLQDEDIISDWFTSLFNQRLHLVSISLSDGRGGESASGIGPGETDGLIRDRHNNRISILEAFKLTCNDNTVIQGHLDKIAGYSPDFISPVIILAYCSMGDFNKFSQQYPIDLKSRQYKGFDPIDPADFKIEALESYPYLKSYSEVRYRDSAPVTFNHYLLDLIH